MSLSPALAPLPLPIHSAHSTCNSLEWFLCISNLFFTGIFTLELILKLYASGVTAYFSRDTNKLDAFVVATAIAGLFYPGFRLFRSLRIVRVLLSVEGTRTAITCLGRTLPRIGNVMLAVSAIYWMFGILGVQLFNGAFYRCEQEPTLSEPQCRERGLDWETPLYNFDNIFYAMLSLNVLAVGEAWTNIMWNAVDATGIGLAPVHNASPLNAAFFVAFMVIGNFFLMNLFTSALIDEFTVQQATYHGNLFMSEGQKAWLMSIRVLTRTGLPHCTRMPTNKTRRHFWKLVTSERFEAFIITVIILNIVFMALEHYMQSVAFDKVLEYSNYVFVGIFILEMTLKIIAFKLLDYLGDNWNKFDALVAVASLAGAILTALPAASVIRMFRIARVLRLVNMAKDLNKLFITLFTALPSLFNIVILLTVVFYIFSLIGMQMCGLVPIEGNPGLGTHANFSTFYHSFLTLYTICTTEGWVDIAAGCAWEAPGCDEVEPSTCGTPWSHLYCSVYVMLGSFILLNAIVSTVIQMFQDGDIEQGTMRLFDLYRFATTPAMPGTPSPFVQPPCRA